MTPLTRAALNRTTLARQLLLERAPLGPLEAVRRLGLVQAQEPASMHLSLWSRLTDLDLADVDDALRSGALVRGSSARLTLHVVAAEDRAWLHAAMLPALRASRVHDRRYRDAGLVPADADALVPGLLAFCAEPRTRDEVEAWIAATAPALDAAWAWWALRSQAGLVHAPAADEPWCFGARVRHLAPADADPTLDPTEGTDAHLDAVGRLVLRYLAAFGPASAQDVGQATMLRQRVLSPAVARLDDALVTRRDEDGRTLLDVPDAPVVDGDVPAPPRLLPMWDSTLLAYADRGRVLPEPVRKVVIRANGDTLPTFTVDGHVAGLWRAVDAGVELHAFGPLQDAAWDGLEAEALTLHRAVSPRDPAPYHRYRRWWDRLPAGGTTRVVAA
ncbi:MAG: winged helix DNA-binding domain-containing protein [Actinomycetes bacterium]